MSWDVGRRHSSDPALLWLWRRLAATAFIRPLAWEPPYTAGVALEKAKRWKKKKKRKRSGEGRHPCLVPHLRRKAFHFSTLLMVAVEFS